MKRLLFVLGHSALFGLAFLAIFWSSTVSLQNRDAQKQIAQLSRDIAQAEDTRDVLEAEWAFLNNPQRLQTLVDIHRAELSLITLAPGHFADDAAIAALSAPANGPEIDEHILAEGPGAVLPYMVNPQPRYAGEVGR